MRSRAPSDRRQVHGTVVEVEDRQDLGPQDPQVEPHSDRDEPERAQLAVPALPRKPVELSSGASQQSGFTSDDVLAPPSLRPRRGELPRLHHSPSPAGSIEPSSGTLRTPVLGGPCFESAPMRSFLRFVGRLQSSWRRSATPVATAPRSARSDHHYFAWRTSAKACAPG